MILSSELRNRQRGAALLTLLAVVILALGFMIVRHPGALDGFAAAKQSRNGQVLGTAKQALIGYVAQQATYAAENNPGRLPCPESPGDYGTANEGRAAGNCTLPAVGRLPWRTLGIDKLVDAAGEPLWYVVSTGWALSNGTAPPLTTFINSNTAGQLNIDGAANDAIALIIAPGPAFNAAAAGPCAAWNQVRPTAGAPDVRNYLECENADSDAGGVFVTAGPRGSFNDQVLRVTTGDLMPALEAAIGYRIERDIAPQIRQVYTSANGWTVPVGSALFPFAAQFSNPEASIDPDPDPGPPTRADRSIYRGTLGTHQGLAPLARHVPGTITWINPAGASALRIGGPGLITLQSCAASTSTRLQCSITWVLAPQLQLQVQAANIGTGFRQPPGIAANLTTNQFASATLTNSLNADGSATVTITLTPNFGLFGLNGTVQLDINAADHAVIDDIATANAWYLRNEWHKLTLYAISQGFAPGSVAACGGANPACLAIQDARYANSDRHAVLVLAGRPLPQLGQARPNATLSNYLEGENLTFADTALRRSAASSSFNDRVVFVSPP
jgi:hypothetical protein